jgi:glucokinase
MTKSIGMIVAGEVRPKETRLALCGLDVGRPIVVAEETVANDGVVGLAPMVQRFLQKYRPPQIRAAAFVVGGPLPWVVGPQSLASELAMDRVTLMSEAEGVAHALPALAPEDLAALNGGEGTEAESGNQVVLSVGTSTGIAGLYWNGTEHRSFGTDGGHADFAPSNEEELRLAQHVSGEGTRVTLEVLLSRAGLARIYAFTRSASPKEPAKLTEAFRTEEPAMVIVREATTGTNEACRRALTLFLGVFGSAASNLALTFHATGGVYVAGDLVPALRAPLGNGVFKAAFGRKAPMEQLLSAIPVHAVLNPKAALLGAATVAARAMREQRGSGWNA